MDSLLLSAPSKTFLLGEYAALAGYPALLINTQPSFKLQITQQSAFKVQGIEPQSPAGRFISDRLPYFSAYQLDFNDPYQQQGGFGASSAQFLLVYHFYKLTQRLNKPLDTLALKTASQDLKACADFIPGLLAHYQHYAWAGKGLPPSGADVISQLQGSLTWYHKAEQVIKVLTWPFADLRMLLIRTGHKLATHQHLAQLEQIPAAELGSILNQAYDALHQVNPALFIQSINDYAAVLQQHGLTATTTQTLLAQLNALPYVKAAKGCGALGADIILVITTLDSLTHLQHWLTQAQLQYYLATLSPGLQLLPS